MDDFDRFWEWANKPPRSRSAISTVRSWGHAANGITGFSVLQNELKARSRKIVLVTFDLLYLNGYDLRKVPLFERKALLKKIIADAEVPFSRSFEVDGPRMFRARLQGRSGRRRLKSTRQPLHFRPHQ